MVGEILAKELSCMTGKRCDDSYVFNESQFGRKVFSGPYAILVSMVHF